jgi:signal transduction histidine kinase
MVAAETHEDMLGTGPEAALGVRASRSSDAPCLTHGDSWPQGVTHGRRGKGDRAEEIERVVRVLTELFDVSELAQRVTESVLPLFRAQFSIAWLRQPDGSLACVAMAGPGPESLKIGDVLPRDVGVVGPAAAERRALWAADVLEAPGVMRTDELGHEDDCAVLAVPLIVKGDVIGAIVTGYPEPRDLAQAEIDLVQAFADQIAPAMRNVQLFANAQAARAAAEAANRAKDELLAILAHELRNSLAPIVTSAELMRRAGPPAAVMQDSAGIVKHHARHLARLLDDLLDVSRIAQGTMELKREPISLAAAVEEVVEATRPLADVAGLAVSLSLPPLPLWIEADPTRVEQIVVNILNNAVKYTPAGGRIEVTAAAEAGAAVLRVHDTGIGIVPEMLPRVFDAFVRSNGARVHTPDGLGVGLTLVHQLVELHGGCVAAHSEGPGLGSEFTVRLPLSRGPEPPGPAAGAASPRTE